MNNLLSYDIDLAAATGLTLAGIDEAGRGPLAGPVCAACVMLPLDAPIEGVNDSKKLTEKKREKLYEAIMERAAAVGVGLVSREEIDRINIRRATHLAMEQAYTAMAAQAGLVLIDGVDQLALPVPNRAIVRGDGTSYHIAAASIVAKVTRDRLLIAMEEQYPGYGFAKHKGYGSEEHIRAIRSLGPCPEHRLSFLGNILGPTRREKGRFGEDMAEKLLLAEGYDVLERNRRTAHGELDIVAMDGGTLAFVEVKYRSGTEYGLPREAVTHAKRLSLTRAALEYVAASGRQNVPCRFDVVELIEGQGDCRYTLLKDAFPAEEVEGSL